jgi:hypothetical protein
MVEGDINAHRVSSRIFSPPSRSQPPPSEGTMKKLMVMLVLLPFLIVQTADAKPKAKPKLNDTPPYDIVSEYIRSLSAVHKIQQSATNESQNNGDDHMQTMMNAIRNFTRLKLELRTSIGMLESMRRKGETFAGLKEITLRVYKEKIKLYDEALTISKIIAYPTPKQGVDYSKMVGRMPEITANLGYLDETLFQSMVLVFGLLIDEKPDGEGHMSHLNITSEERQSLIDHIDAGFGESLESDSKNYTVSSVVLLKAWLLKDYKSTDEWQQK